MPGIFMFLCAEASDGNFATFSKPASLVSLWPKFQSVQSIGLRHRVCGLQLLREG